MGIFISLALLVLSAAGTLAAFGGKTWLDDERPLLQRITRRGWIALTCLALATVAGGTKAYLDSRSAATASEQRDRQSLAIAEQRGELKQARASLERFSQANLAMALSGDQFVSGLRIDLPLPGEPGHDASIGEVLYPALPPEYRPLARIEIALSAVREAGWIHARYGDAMIDTPVDIDGWTSSAIPSQAGLRLTHGAEHARGVRGASAYSRWTENSEPLTIGVGFVMEAPTRSEIDAFDRAHPGLRGRLRSDGKGGFIKTYEPPAGLARALERAIVTRFAGATAMLSLVNSRNEPLPVSIVADLRCDHVWRFNETLRFGCRTAGSPRIEIERY